jgi:hypothetical protein
MLKMKPGRIPIVLWNGPHAGKDAVITKRAFTYSDCVVYKGSTYRRRCKTFTNDPVLEEAWMYVYVGEGESCF